MQLQAPKGMKDVLPQESYQWHYVESMMREICHQYGFLETRTPVLEYTELFLRGVGDTTDIVQKEMYTFVDKGDRSVTLKPEGTAGVARMFLENKLFANAQPTKMYYLYCPVFRYDKPQAGRLREHHQFGVEIYGAELSSADAECISLAVDLFQRLNITGLKVKINSIGCPSCRAVYNDRLKEHLRANYDSLCEVCHSRFEKNPLRILDCKEERCKQVCKDAPSILDCLCEDCASHFASLQKDLTALGIDYEVDPMIVRGLDYYTKTVFEIVADMEEYQGTVCGGGRYNNLLEQLGGPSMPAVGFGMGMERLLLVAKAAGALKEPETPDIYLAALGDEARAKGMALVKQLRKANLWAEFDHVGRSAKAQFKYADKIKAKYVAVLGDDELSKNIVKLKDMAGGQEQEVSIDRLSDTLTKILNK